jgi:hypothetical protein
MLEIIDVAPPRCRGHFKHLNVSDRPEVPRDILGNSPFAPLGVETNGYLLIRPRESFLIVLPEFGAGTHFGCS